MNYFANHGVRLLKHSFAWHKHQVNGWKQYIHFQKTCSDSIQSPRKKMLTWRSCRRLHIIHRLRGETRAELTSHRLNRSPRRGHACFIQPQYGPRTRMHSRGKTQSLCLGSVAFTAKRAAWTTCVFVQLKQNANSLYLPRSPAAVARKSHHYNCSVWL